MARAVTTAWASAFVTTPSTTGWPPQAPTACPGRTCPVTNRARPRPDRADPHQITDAQGIFGENLERARPQALEADLDRPTSLLLHLKQRREVVQRGHRRLLQIDVRARSEGDGCQSEVRTKRRSDDHDIHRADCRKCFGQIGVQVCPVDGGRVQDDSGVDGRDELDQALIRESSDPLGVDLSEPPNADQNDPGWRGRGTGCCGGKVHPGVPCPSTQSPCISRKRFHNRTGWGCAAFDDLVEMGLLGGACRGPARRRWVPS